MKATQIGRVSEQTKGGVLQHYEISVTECANPNIRGSALKPCQ